MECFGRFFKFVAALTTKFSSKWDNGTTGRTFELKLSSTIFTKLYLFTILKLTFRAF
jgi:hypothetical protein